MGDGTRATRSWFVLTGVLVGSFAVSTAEIEAASGLDRAVFGAVLAVGLLAGAAANVLAGRQCVRSGAATVARRWGVAWSSALALAAVVGDTALISVAMVAMWVTLAGVDVTMNIAATAALGRRPGRLLVFNTWFNIGAVVGALSTAGVAAAGGSWRLVWAALAFLALWSVARSAPTGPGDRHRPVPRIGRDESRRRGVAVPVVVLAAALFGAGVVGAGLDVWGVVYLRQDLGASLTGGAFAVVAGQVVAIIARLGAGAVAAGSGVRVALAGTGLAVVVGIAVLTTASTVPLAALGLALTMGVLSCAWPLALLQTARVSAQPAAALGIVSAAGQIGHVIGPFVVAWVAQSRDLIIGLRVLVVGGVFVLVGGSLVRRGPSAIDAEIPSVTSVAAVTESEP